MIRVVYPGSAPLMGILIFSIPGPNFFPSRILDLNQRILVFLTQKIASKLSEI